MEKNYKTFDVGTHIIKMMPNLTKDNNVGKPVVELTACSTSIQKPILLTKYFTYCLVNNKVDIYTLGKHIYQIISASLNGELLVNSDGLVLKFKNEVLENEDIYNYFIKDNNIIEFNSEDPTAKTDIEKLQINLYDLTCEYFLKFDVINKNINGFSLKDYTNIFIIKQDAIYKNGDDKNNVLNLYNGIFNLYDIIDDYKLEINQYTTKDGTLYGPYLYDEEAKKYFRKQRQL